MAAESDPAAAPIPSAGGRSFTTSARPTVLGPSTMVSTGHYLATAAAADVLARGGNAVDAGVAAGLCLNVVHNDMNTLSGVAPIILSVGGRTVTIAGIGTWPAGVTRDLLRDEHGGIPDSLLRCVVPAAASAWLTALAEFGTMSFEQVSRSARAYARDGFPVHTFMHHAIGAYLPTYRQHPENARIFLRDGAPPPVGEIVRQPDLAATLEGMVAAERGAAAPAAASGAVPPADRRTAIAAVADLFYRGPIAASMASFMREHGGRMTEADLAGYQAEVGQPATLHFGDVEVAACGPWSQGPSLLLALNVLRHVDLERLGHNSAAYVNAVASALDLAFADRNAHLGDPAFVDVPMQELLSDAYGELRAGLLPQGTAYGAPVDPGDPRALRATDPSRARRAEEAPPGWGKAPGGTSCITVVDAHGDLFAATPSDGYCNGPIIPGLGLHVSERGSQSFLGDGDPNVVAPGKRPRLTPNPVLVFRDGRPLMAMASPGNDRQVQAMLQVLLNLLVFGHTPQQAVEAPRFASFNFRASTWPGETFPGRLCLEEGIPDDVARTLQAWGRDVRRWPAWCWTAGGVCLSMIQPNGVRAGAADPRRESYAVGA